VDGVTDLLDARARVPRHVVYREFPAETVMLNLETGQYHGINTSGGRILARLEHARDVREAAGALAEEYAQPQAEVERDVRLFCEALLERGLIELEPGHGD
jgi:hypothetical protein